MKLKRFNTLGKETKKVNEAFDWENYDDTDLSGPGWEMSCEELITNFVEVLKKQIPGDTALDKANRKEALLALGTLFKQQLDEARKTV